MTQPLPAVVTIFNLATTATIPLTALFEAQFTANGVATTVAVSFAQIGTSIGALPVGGASGAILQKLGTADQTAGWVAPSSFVLPGTGVDVAASTTTLALTVGLSSVAALSVLGVAGTTQAPSLPIIASASGLVLQRLGSAIVFALAPARIQRSVTSSTSLPVATTDSILNFTLATALAVSVPAASSRSGQPLTFKDSGLTFSTNNLTLNPSGGDTFDGLTSITLSVDGQAMTLTPYNDGVNAGYAIG